MAQIDRKSKTPVYKQIYEDINMRILMGEYTLGSMLPSESKLCSIYGVERATVRRALALMVDDGKIAKIPGLGASVMGPTETIKSTKRKTLLFLLPKGDHEADHISEPFNAKLMDTMEHECFQRGFDLLYKTFSDRDTADDLVRVCNPSGVFFISYLPNEIYRDLHRIGVPVVLVNQTHPVYPSICLDNRGGSKMVVEYLVALGHKKIGFICGAPLYGQNQTNRFNGFIKALASNGLALNNDWVLQGNWSMESGTTAMKQLIDKGDLPTAIFAANDTMAMGAIIGALDAGISVPGDISIVGFDNINQSSYFRPSLTTVAVDYKTMSRAACMLMFEMIDHNSLELNVNIYVPLSLIDRGSTQKAKPDAI